MFLASFHGPTLDLICSYKKILGELYKNSGLNYNEITLKRIKKTKKHL